MTRLISVRESVAALAGLAALLVIFLSSCRFHPGIDRKLHGAIGTALGREAVKLVGQGGGVIIITRDTAAFPQPAIEVLLDNLKRELRRAGANIRATRLIQADPIRPAEVPPGDFVELIQRASRGDVILSLLGPPILNADQRDRLTQMKPKIVAFCSGSLAENLDLVSLFQADLLHAAVVSRPLSMLRTDQ